MCPDCVLSRTPQFPRHKHTSERLFYRTALSGCFQMSIIFPEREKQKKVFIPPEAVVRRCSLNKGAPKNFRKSKGKHLFQGLSFNKFAGLRLWHKCFLVNFVKISRTPFLEKASSGSSIPSLCLIHLKPCNCINVLDTLETL